MAKAHVYYSRGNEHGYGISRLANILSPLRGSHLAHYSTRLGALAVRRTVSIHTTRLHIIFLGIGSVIHFRTSTCQWSITGGRRARPSLRG